MVITLYTDGAVYSKGKAIILDERAFLIRKFLLKKTFQLARRRG